MNEKWVMLGVIMLFLIGTISWAMPTPRQRAQAKIRKLAQAKGVQVKVEKFQPPRVLGEAEATSHLAVSYGLVRHKKPNKKSGINKSSINKSGESAWCIHRLNGLYNDGLPNGWCWQMDNNKSLLVDNKKLVALTNLIEQLPQDVYAVSGSAFSIRIYWHEQATPEELDKLIEQLTIMLNASS